MKLLTKIAAGILLGIGLPLTALAVEEIVNPDTADPNRGDAIAGLFLFGLPPSTLGGWLIWNGIRQNRKAERDRLRETFFRLVKEDQGHITSLRFSMETGLEGDAAKQYLDDRAKEFNASYNVTEEGKFSYFFDGFTSDPSPD